MQPIARHKAAIRRQELSRPVRVALEDGIISIDSSFLDYGCGLGDDVRNLQARGLTATGWDPVHAPDVARTPADVVNLGYVLNVIEDPAERLCTIKQAWSLAQRALVIAARLTMDSPGGHDVFYKDGYLTRLGTFQKYYEQSELRTVLQSALGEVPIAAGPGVFYVFRDTALKESILSRRQRRAVSVPRVRKSDEMFELNRDLLLPLMEFAATQGRLPHSDELNTFQEIENAIGSVKRAFALIRRVTGSAWVSIREARTQDLLIYLALARFEGRPAFSALPRALQYDIRGFFSTYASACRQADERLFEAGKMDIVDKLCSSSKIGKQTPSALYVHVSALERLPTVLRVYEGCARAYMGTVAGANVVKIHRDKPAVSYLYYPTFDTEAHPALIGSLLVYLQGPAVKYRDYAQSENPPILHRKEEFVANDYALRDKFEKLTSAEEKHELYEDTTAIGTRSAWQSLLLRRGLRIEGHRVLRAKLPRSGTGDA